jgi:hypothetical protein
MTELMSFEAMLPAANTWGVMKQQAGELIRSGFLPSGIKTPEQAVAIMLKGRELGIPPMQALSHIHVINGKPTMSAELMLSQVLRLHPKTKISYPKRSGETCEIKVQRDGSEPSVFSFSIADAQAAGLMSNPTWKKYPRAMLHARAVSEMARSLFPDAISGVSYTPEEMNAPVDENGEIIDVAVTETKSPLVQSPVAVAPVEVKPAAAPSGVEAFTKTPSQIKQLAAFLTAKSAASKFDDMCNALDGKDFTRTNINAAWEAVTQ